MRGEGVKERERGGGGEKGIERRRQRERPRERKTEIGTDRKKTLTTNRSTERQTVKD